MCSIQKRLRQEKRKYDEFDSKRLRAAAYQELVVAEKNRDICKGSKKGSYEEKEGPVKEDFRSYMDKEALAEA